MSSGLECCYYVPFTVQDFFADAPWLQIPSERQGEILIEPLYPRRGLYGGSPGAGEAKISKLAALAAARRKKENEKNISPESEGSNASVAILETLDRRTRSRDVSNLKGPASSGLEGTPSVAATSVPIRRSRKYPSKRQDLSPSATPGNDTPKEPPPLGSETDDSAQEADPRSTPTAAPSVFAKTMFGGAQDPLPSTLESLWSRTFSFPGRSGAKAKSDPFAGPSPDDVVAKAQSSSKGSARKAEAN